MYATNHFETAFLNTLRGTTLTAPANMYLGLMLSSPGEAGGGTEIAYTGYARQRVQFTVPAFDAGVNATAIKNTAQITFPTSSTDAGTVTHIALFDSLTGGNKWALLPLCKDIRHADRFTAVTGAVVILGKDLPLTESGTAGLLAVAFPFAKNLGVEADPAALLGCVCDASTLETLSMLLGVSIPNGSSITVDTRLFSAQMGDVNLLPVHNGDWPTISREAVSMTVEGLGGSVAGTLLVTPLYL